MNGRAVEPKERGVSLQLASGGGSTCTYGNNLLGRLGTRLVWSLQGWNRLQEPECLIGKIPESKFDLTVGLEKCWRKHDSGFLSSLFEVGFFCCGRASGSDCMLTTICTVVSIGYYYTDAPASSFRAHEPGQAAFDGLLLQSSPSI